MDTKVCKQCGKRKPIDQYRKYYGGRKGSYTMCKTCEKINARAKYLVNKGDNKTAAEYEELHKINMLWDAQSAAGLKPPKQSAGCKTPLTESLDEMISEYTKQAEEVKSVVETDKPVPAELNQWLTKPLTEDPDYYLDTVYESLKDTYRPLLHIKDNMTPVYDETYATVLDAILERFYDYEESYYM